MAIKPTIIAIAAGTIIFCYFWLIISYSGETKIFQSIPSGKVKSESVNNYYPFTNLNNSKGKIGKILWNSIEPALKCPTDHLSKVGIGIHGKIMCGLIQFGAYLERNPDYPCVVYSFGVLTDSTFEADVLKFTRCPVYAYDPTVDHMAEHVDISNPRVHFFKMGIGGNNANRLKTLKTLMKQNGGHEWIDIFKMDIEGYEQESFDNIFQDFDQLPFGQLMVELHFTLQNRTEAMSDRILQFIRNLEMRGLRMFSNEINTAAPEYCSELSFINVRALDKFLNVEQG